MQNKTKQDIEDLQQIVSDNSSAIGQLQTDMGNIDVSWNAITGKPTTFAPSTHDHAGQLVLEVGQYIDYHISGNTTDYDARSYVNGSGQFTITDANGTCSVNSEINSLKSSVVNGKQAVVNAINGSLGYASGLTTSHPHSDYAWWIQNKVAAGWAGTILYKNGVCYNGFNIGIAKAIGSDGVPALTINSDNFQIQLGSKYFATWILSQPIAAPNGALVTMEFITTMTAYNGSYDIGAGYSVNIANGPQTRTLELYANSNFRGTSLNGRKRTVSFYIQGNPAYIWLSMPQDYSNIMKIYGLYIDVY